MSASDMKSSLPLEIAVYYNKFYAPALIIVCFLTFIYKGILLPYPPNALGLEVAFVFLYGFIEWARLHLASRGNRVELISPTFLSLCLAAPTIVFHSYMISLQVYVLRLDLIIHAIALIFVGVQVFFEILAILSFWRASRW